MKKEGERLSKKIKVLFSPEAREFYRKLSDKAKKKVDAAIKKTEAGIPGDWFKKLTGTDDIYEFSADADNHFYRLFAFWDKRGEEQTLIVCTHGIEKKTNKTPEAAKKKAEKMKKEWLAAVQ
jgi:phage-related protein